MCAVDHAAQAMSCAHVNFTAASLLCKIELGKHVLACAAALYPHQLLNSFRSLQNTSEQCYMAHSLLHLADLGFLQDQKSVKRSD